MSMHGPTSGVSTLEWNEARLLSIIESAMDAIITIDESQRVILFNKAAERLFGVPAADALGTSIDRFVPERHRKGHAEHIRAFGSTGVTMRQMGLLGTLSGLRADGTEFPIEASISHSMEGGRHLFTVILRDISERKRLEEQLLHAQKMEVIGRLAGGIAHDFNNLLMAIFNYLMLATKALEPEHPSRAALAQVHEASNRAANLTRQLLTFARKQVAKPRIISVRDVVTALEPMLNRLMGSGIVIKADLAPDTGSARIDPTQLEQVIMNLVVNARDATPSEGVITISTSNLDLDDAYCLSTVGATPGPFVLIAVTDTGVGMSKEVLQRLFEPFFTTKEPGKGTGLGLATCHGIVTQNGGHITVHSAPGAGTCVRVLLPRASGQPGTTSLASKSSPADRGTETVVFAEDSSVVRELITSALRQFGYTVLSAAGGPEALRLSQEHLGRVHMLVADLVLPGMSGQELAAALQAQRGPMPVLYISGGGEDAALQPGLNQPGISLLAKPFTTGILLKKIRSMLDAKPA